MFHNEGLLKNFLKSDIRAGAPKARFGPHS